jgi:hypothetical protein
MSSLKDIKLFLEESEKELYAEPQNEPLTKDLKVQYSVDNRIDSFLIKFESESQVPDEDMILESLKDLTLRALLEQGAADDAADDAAEAEDEVEEEAEDEAGEDSPVETEPTGSERISVDEPIEAPQIPLDVDQFALRVGKLIKNADVLLDLKTVIVNRSLKFLSDNYDEAHAKRLLESLDSQFDIDIDDPGAPVETPFAAGAYAGGTGGLGGGG